MTGPTGRLLLLLVLLASLVFPRSKGGLLVMGRGTSAILVVLGWLLSSSSFWRVTIVLLLEGDRSLVGSPVEVVTIVGQELLGEVAFRDGLGLGLPGAFSS